MILFRMSKNELNSNEKLLVKLIQYPIIRITLKPSFVLKYSGNQN